ncbi:MMPL family transporter [Streptomyces sp. NPDC001215]
MAAGVLIDAVVVRTLLTPALVVLFGRANWYLPRWAAKVLLIKPTGAVEKTDHDDHDDDPLAPAAAHQPLRA